MIGTPIGAENDRGSSRSRRRKRGHPVGSGLGIEPPVTLAPDASTVTASLEPDVFISRRWSSQVSHGVERRNLANAVTTVETAS